MSDIQLSEENSKINVACQYTEETSQSAHIVESLAVAHVSPPESTELAPEHATVLLVSTHTTEMYKPLNKVYTRKIGGADSPQLSDADSLEDTLTKMIITASKVEEDAATLPVQAERVQPTDSLENVGSNTSKDDTDDRPSPMPTTQLNGDVVTVCDAGKENARETPIGCDESGLIDTKSDFCATSENLGIVDDKCQTTTDEPVVDKPKRTMSNEQQHCKELDINGDGDCVSDVSNSFVQETQPASGTTTLPSIDDTKVDVSLARPSKLPVRKTNRPDGGKNDDLKTNSKEKKAARNGATQANYKNKSDTKGTRSNSLTNNHSVDGYTVVSQYDSQFDENVDSCCTKSVPVSPAGPKRVQFRDQVNGSSSEDEQFLKDTYASNIVSFQEPKSFVAQYIKGQSSARPVCSKQRSLDNAELTRQPKPTQLNHSIYDKGAAPKVPVKQTIASRKRLEKLHEEEQSKHQQELNEESSYVTPLQRKEVEVRELKRQLHEAYFVIEQRELELDVFHHKKDQEVKDLIDEKDAEIDMLQKDIENIREKYEELLKIQSETAEAVSLLEEKLNQVNEEFTFKERRHQEMYLEMYRKGRDSAIFERQDELEKLAAEEPDKVAVGELLGKLEVTQQELEKWQSIKLAEHYDEAIKPETDAQTRLRFMRDSMYHYLTDNSKEAEQHLKAMVGIFSFSAVQMKTISKALDEKKKKGRI